MFLVDAAPVHRRRLQQRLLAEQLLGELRQEAKQPRVFQDPAAERIHHGDRATPLHLDQSHHPQARICAQVKGIGVVGVDAAQHHVDALESAQRAHPELSVAHHQVGALDEREAQHRREVGLVERRLGVHAGAQHHDHRVVGRVGGGVDQSEPQRLRERRGRPRPDALVQVGHRVRDHAAVGQRIACARRRLRPVPVHPKASRRVPAHVAAVHEQLVPARDLDAAGRPDVAGMAEHQLRGQQALEDAAARPVQVGEHRVQQPRPLQQACLQRLPVGGGDQQRQPVEVPRARRRGIGPVGDRVTVVVDFDVGDAVVVHQAAHRGPQPLQPCAAALTDRVGQFLPRGPDVAVHVDELVVAGPGPATQVEQCLLGARGAVAGEQAIGVVAGRGR